MLTKSLSHDLRQSGVNVMSINPGWVKTSMGGANAPLTPEESVEGMLNVISNFDEKIQNGGFFDYNGKQLPW